MSGAIPPLPNTPSWRGDQLKKEAQGQLYLYLTFTCQLILLEPGSSASIVTRLRAG
jgi:hypothetical protein